MKSNLHKKKSDKLRMNKIITAEMLNYTRKEAKKGLIDIMNEVLFIKNFPFDWTSGIGIPIYEKVI